MRLAAALLLLSLAQGARAGERPSGLPGSSAEAVLRRAYIGFFNEDPRNSAALETASVLEDGVSLSVETLWNDEVLAHYDGLSRSIVLNLVPLLSRFGSGRWVTEESAHDFRNALVAGWQRDPGALRQFVERTGPLIVHEARHALYDRRLRASWNTIEEELACRTHEVLFLRARLRRDPEYLGLGEYDRLARRLLAEEPSAADWWADPLPGQDEARLGRAMGRLRRELLGEFEDVDSAWRAVRSFNGDPQLFWDSLERELGGYYDSIDQDGRDLVAIQRLRVERLEEQSAAAVEEDRRLVLRGALASERAALVRLEDFWSDSGRVKAYRAFFAEEMEGLRTRIEQERRYAAASPSK